MKRLIFLIALGSALPYFALGQSLSPAQPDQDPSSATAPSETTLASPGQFASANLPAPTSYSVVERGPHHRVWQRQVYELSPRGPVAKPHQYTELATGLCYWSDGAWRDTEEKIVPLPDGGAAATNGQHRVYFPADIYRGVIEQVTPEGLHLKDRPLGISYCDGTNNVLIAELTNSIGQILPSGNQIIWTNCLTDGVVADLLCTYRKGGFECDLIFRSRPPAPQDYGLNPDHVQLQVLSEFFDTPEPTQAVAAVDPQEGLIDSTLHFGATRMVRGKAFTTGKTSSSADSGIQGQPSAADRASSSKPDASKPIPVYKTWQHFPDGRILLIEEVPFKQIKPHLDSLAVVGTGTTSLLAVSGSTSRKPSHSRQLPPARSIHSSEGQVLLARNDLAGQPGVILDYTEVNPGEDNYTFIGSSTYYVSGGCSLSGTTTIQPGSVIKFYDSPSGTMLEITGDLICQTTPFCQAVLTDMNDNSVGEVIGWDSPSTHSYGCYFNLDGAASAYSVSNLRFCYAHSGIVTSYGGPVDIWDCQFLFCNDAVVNGNYSAPIQMHNNLFAGCSAVMDFALSGGALVGEHITADCSNLWDVVDNTPAQVNLTNSILLGCIPSGSVTFNTNYFVVNPDGPVFQAVGGGNYYLPADSPYRNAGTTNLSPAILADLAQRTTQAPTTYTDYTFTTNTVFSRCVARDNSGSPDLGFHYFPLDYAFGGCEGSANLTFAAGVAAGWFRTSSGWYHAAHGIHMDDGLQINFNGTLENPCYWMRLNTVQEQDQTGGYGPGGISSWATTLAAQLNGSFVRFVALSWENGSHFRDDWGYLGANLAHCQFWNAGINGYVMNLNFTNCEFNGVVVALGVEVNIPSLYVRNCAFHGGCLITSHWDPNQPWPTTVLDSVFDGASVSTDDPTGGNTNIIYFDFNAFLTNYDRTYPTGAHDVVVTNYNWQTGWLGNYYLPTNSPLISRGSCTADQIGLYHFTTQTNQVKEGSSQVEIGYHYVALDGSGNAVDTNGDGLPDYLSDVNGNGLIDSGEIGWSIIGDLGFKVFITRPKNNSILP